MRRFFNLSQLVENGMVYYPGDPQPEIRPAQGTTPPWRVTELHIGTHTGTHIDASSHYYEKGMTIDQYPVERFVLPGICLSIDGLNPGEAIERDRLEAFLPLIPKGGAAVIRTGWDRYWGQELYFRHPYLAPSAAQSLAAAGGSLVGIDALNVDSTAQGTEAVHEILLTRNILIVENLKGLDQLVPGEEIQFSFLPLLLSGLDGSPVRAVAWKDEIE